MLPARVVTFGDVCVLVQVALRAGGSDGSVVGQKGFIMVCDWKFVNVSFNKEN